MRPAPWRTLRSAHWADRSSSPIHSADVPVTAPTLIICNQLFALLDAYGLVGPDRPGIERRRMPCPAVFTMKISAGQGK